MHVYHCTICGAPGARFRRYKRVRGYSFLSTCREMAPVAVCARHKFRASLKTTALNMLLGWWAIHALVWNIIALIQNSLGGRDATEDVENLYAQEVRYAIDAVQKSDASK